MVEKIGTRFGGFGDLTAAANTSRIVSSDGWTASYMVMRSVACLVQIEELSNTPEATWQPVAATQSYPAGDGDGDGNGQGNGQGNGLRAAFWTAFDNSEYFSVKPAPMTPQPIGTRDTPSASDFAVSPALHLQPNGAAC